MRKPASKGRKQPEKLPSVPESESSPSRYNEPSLPASEDRMPVDRFELGDTRADLRIRVERLLRRREAASEIAWAELGPDARSLLLEMLDDESVRSDESLLHRVIAVVGQLAVQRGIAPLSMILGDKSARPVTRAYAANALGRIGDIAALEALIVSVKVKDDMIRRQVAMALGRIDHDAVVPHLLNLSKDMSIAVAEIANEALRLWEEKGGGRLGGKRGKSAENRKSPKRKRMPAEER